MTVPDEAASQGMWWHELLDAVPARTAQLATVRADGRPHVAPVWVIRDGDDVVFMTGTETVKGRNIRREGRVAMCVDDDRPPFSFVLFEGEVTLDEGEDPDVKLRWATDIAARYMGADQAEAYGRRNAVPDELVVRLTPDRVVGERAVAG